MSKAITIVVLTCFLVLGAATNAILGRDSVPSVSAEMISQTPPAKPLAANRAAKADRLVPTLALASAAIEPVQVAADKLAQAPVLTEPLRQAFAAATPSDFPMPKASAHQAPAAAEIPAVEVPAKPKVVAKPQPQKSYSLLSDAQIAGIRDRLKLSSSQEYYWPSVETALRNVVRKISANKLSNPNAPGVPIDPNCDEVQQLKSAAMPLLFQLRDDQKEEVRKLARIIGLEKVAQQI
ncbi:hypothetical protein IVB15_16550 [Bradyrhizobium sp. 182]|uniref:hypothetical protein n=1 Tax=unclassified Bradyrhizobium TaxID=2631580 RepID=UPI001FF8CE50|nr:MULTISPECIES: hypothetical protein [unclassified Bradyrhizobium]MCK1422536.1 hypothetical protein [Bradyrhizobium sp. CW12]MCK1529287.1 hypothetical protein [Bradyrhizobium sp. 182]MCK1598321.1 hypothetical protein [Bradyrhizobium sp. 164]MCK1649786.1 hypothetical protein [Bradyrhizobium sp. 154]MCK1669259.1 hypothetical protein [Bradyrhizobium sp. 153]